MPQAQKLVRDVLAGRRGSVNEFISCYGGEIVDYVSSLLPERQPPFEKVVEDILVDALAQCRTALRIDDDEQVREYIFRSATTTVRNRHSELLKGEADPRKASSLLSFEQVLKATGMNERELTASISEGRIRAVRADNQMVFPAQDLPNAKAYSKRGLYYVSARERELLCLAYRLRFSPELIGQWLGSSADEIEARLSSGATELASRQVVKGRL
ncbi:MAG: hypothetical protein OEY28_03980 [Nitrospira sp.]|nr:hypothetical protein [Nitrospira sp.]